MADRYLDFATSRPGGFVARRLGLPRPAELVRHRPGDPVVRGPVVLGGPRAAEGGRLAKPLRAALDSCAALVTDRPEEPPGALVFDATGIADPAGLAELHAFFHP